MGAKVMSQRKGLNLRAIQISTFRNRWSISLHERNNAPTYCLTLKGEESKIERKTTVARGAKCAFASWTGIEQAAVGRIGIAALAEVPYMWLMKTTRRYFTGVFGLGVMGGPKMLAAAVKPTPAPNKTTSRARRAVATSRLAEVLALRRFAELTHPRGREASADQDWRKRWDTLAQAADRFTDGGYFLQTRRALAWFGDGHTTTLPFEFTGGVPAALAQGSFALSVPMRVRVFHDGAYVTDAAEEALPLLGARLDQVGSATTEALLRNWAQDWPGNDAWAQRWSASLFGSPAFLQGLGAVGDPRAPLRFVGTRDQRTVELFLRPRVDAAAILQSLPRTQSDREAWAADAGCENYARIIEACRALYISLDAMENLEKKSFEAFTRECAAAMESTNVERLIIDLRRNGGGNNFFPEVLRKKIARSRFNRQGALLVLISPVTFSAAQNLATRLERETFALFVGEPTGGRPNHFGDASVFTGSVTGLTSIVSSLPWFDSYPDDKRAWIAPDAPAPMLFDDWRSGRDGALGVALTLQTAAGFDEYREDAVFFYRRKSQQVPWRPFWRS